MAMLRSVEGALASFPDDVSAAFVGETVKETLMMALKKRLISNCLCVEAHSVYMW